MGPNYEQYFKEDVLNNYYCLNNINYILNPIKQSIVILVHPCKNTTDNNNHCKPKEFINEFLNNRHCSIKYGDIIIMPTNYHNSIKRYLASLDTYIFESFGYLFYIDYELVRIETNTNIVGFDFLTSPKIEEYVKFDNFGIFARPGFDLDNEENNNSSLSFTFQINEYILFEKRHYIQLIDIFGEIEGFMEFINSFFGLICSFMVAFLYEKTIVHDLFSFNIKKKYISIKQCKNYVFKINKEKIKGEKNLSNQIISPNDIQKYKNKEKVIIMETTGKDIDDKKSDKFLIKKNILLENNSLNKYDKIKNFDNHSVKNSFKEINKKRAE